MSRVCRGGCAEGGDGIGQMITQRKHVHNDSPTFEQRRPGFPVELRGLRRNLDAGAAYIDDKWIDNIRETVTRSRVFTQPPPRCFISAFLIRGYLERDGEPLRPGESSSASLKTRAVPGTEGDEAFPLTDGYCPPPRRSFDCLFQSKMKRKRQRFEIIHA